ncbi:MAG: twin-arginine translocation signal domain-containing protein [Methanobacteriota archaeon]
MREPVDRREFLKKAAVGSIALASIPALGTGLVARASAADEADQVRWDIISLDHAPPSATISPGGVAFATAPTHATPPLLRIRFTGAGTFVAPSSGGESSGVTGGGTWETFDATGASSGSGTYRVKRLVSWQFANLQSQTPLFFDNIGDTNERANGNAFLVIAYSDGSGGILGVLCHGPGAPAGIHEGILATKGVVTYMNSEGPETPFSDKNRTIFHVGQ